MLTFKAFSQETNLSLPERNTSWRVLILATIIWPLVVPISNLEKVKKRLEKAT
jgi:hypothetical protein